VLSLLHILSRLPAYLKIKFYAVCTLMISVIHEPTYVLYMILAMFIEICFKLKNSLPF